MSSKCGLAVGQKMARKCPAWGPLPLEAGSHRTELNNPCSFRRFGPHCPKSAESGQPNSPELA